MDIKIIYEDENFLAVNKPSGLMVHSDGKSKERTLCDWILKNYPETENVGEPLKLSSGEIIKKPGIVHRLDKETSGVILIAKNQDTFLCLKKQFQERKVKKIYKAFVYGVPPVGGKEEKGVIDRAVGRSKKDFRLWSAQRGARGVLRKAITEYKVLKKNSSIKLGAGKDFSFVEIYPKTGRTHQIRAHFKAINHPIVCDKLYAPKRECALGFNRLALHAFSIEIVLPDGETRKFESELPIEFKKAAGMLAF